MKISKNITIQENEIETHAIRSQGAGGQNVNKVSTAVHLRFHIKTASLPDSVKEKLLAISDRRISPDGIITIKAQRFNSQEKNRNDARDRLFQIVQNALKNKKKRVATKPSQGSKTRRMDSKTKRGSLKSLRKKVDI